MISGTLTAYVFTSTFTSVAVVMSRERELGRYALIFVSGVSTELYSLSIALAQVISDTVPFVTIIALGFLLFHIEIESVPLLLLALASSILLTSSFGSFLASIIRNSYQVGQFQRP